MQADCAFHNTTQVAVAPHTSPYGGRGRGATPVPPPPPSPVSALSRTRRKLCLGCGTGRAHHQPNARDCSASQVRTPG